MSILNLTSLSRSLGIMLEDNLNGDDQDDKQQQDNEDEFEMGDDGGEDESNQEGDTDPQANNDESDDTGDGGDEFSMDDTDDTSGNDGGEEPTNQEDEEDATSEENGTNDDQDEFSMDGDGGEGETGSDEDTMGDDTSSDTGSDNDNAGDDNATDVDQNNPNEKLKELEKSIFDILSPEQQQAKIKELKNLYNDVHLKSQSIIDMITSTSKDPVHAKVYDYIMNNLLDLQRYIKDYLMNIFDSKTYIENLTELQKYMTVLDTVSNVFDEIKKDSETAKE